MTSSINHTPPLGGRPRATMARSTFNRRSTTPRPAWSSAARAHLSGVAADPWQTAAARLASRCAWSCPRARTAGPREGTDTIVAPFGRPMAATRSRARGRTRLSWPCSLCATTACVTWPWYLAPAWTTSPLGAVLQWMSTAAARQRWHHTTPTASQPRHRRPRTRSRREPIAAATTPACPVALDAGRNPGHLVDRARCRQLGTMLAAVSPDRPGRVLRPGSARPPHRTATGRREGYRRPAAGLARPPSRSRSPERRSTAV
jgi:hypothetical protein